VALMTFVVGLFFLRERPAPETVRR
jgi:hypothetical protein